MHVTRDVLDKFADLEISVQTLPPNTTHKTQSLDVGVFGPLKKAFCKDLARRAKFMAMLCKENFPEYVLRRQIINKFHADQNSIQTIGPMYGRFVQGASNTKLLCSRGNMPVQSR